MDVETSVLIVGGSLNGLSAAALLAQRAVPCLVVERHPTTSIQYKFRGISPRSMEIYRSLGVEADIRARDLIDNRSAYVARMKNLGDAEIAWQGIPWSDTSDISPATAATCDQDQLEPMLRARAEGLGADVRFNTELVDFTRDADGVSARFRERTTGADQSIRALSLIAADGADSPVRAALGVARHGPTPRRCRRTGCARHRVRLHSERSTPRWRLMRSQRHERGGRLALMLKRDEPCHSCWR